MREQEMFVWTYAKAYERAQAVVNKLYGRKITAEHFENMSLVLILSIVQETKLAMWSDPNSPAHTPELLALELFDKAVNEAYRQGRR